LADIYLNRFPTSNACTVHSTYCPFLHYFVEIIFFSFIYFDSGSMAHKNNRQIAIDKKTVQKDKKDYTIINT